MFVDMGLRRAKGSKGQRTYKRLLRIFHSLFFDMKAGLECKLNCMLLPNASPVPSRSYVYEQTEQSKPNIYVTTLLYYL